MLGTCFLSLNDHMSYSWLHYCGITVLNLFILKIIVGDGIPIKSKALTKIL